jgi:hypothetical protein
MLEDPEAMAHMRGCKNCGEVRASPVQSFICRRGLASLGRAESWLGFGETKNDPRKMSEGRTSLSATQVSGLPARPPSTTGEADGLLTQYPARISVGLGQSHLSQKIPATTTRCVYLDHLLSVPSTRRSVLPVFAPYKGSNRKFFKPGLRWRRGASTGRRRGWRSVPG